MNIRRSSILLVFTCLHLLLPVGCQAASPRYTSVELRGLIDKGSSTHDAPLFLGKGDSVIINDTDVASRLATFFPGLGSGRKSFWGIKSPRIMELRFTTDSGATIIAYTKLYKYWGSDLDQGDFYTDGDLLDYLRALFANPHVTNHAQGVSDESAGRNEQGNYSPLVSAVGNLLGRRDELSAPDTRVGLIRALGDSRDPRAFTTLVCILNGNYLAGTGAGDLREREEAAYSLGLLGQVGKPRTLVVLKSAIDSGRLGRDIGVRAIGLLAIYGDNKEARQYVLHALANDPEEEVRLSAARVLDSGPKDSDVTKALLQAVGSDVSMRVRVDAACCLLDRGDRTQWSFLKAAAVNNDPAVRIEVADRIPFADEGIPILLQLLADDDFDVAGAAWEPLEKHLEIGGHPGDIASAHALVGKYREAWNESQRK